MKKGLSLLLMLWLSIFLALPAWADNKTNVDTVTWLKGNYIGIGGIDVDKFSKTPLYGYLMDFFATDQAVNHALEELRSTGLVPEKLVHRIVAGIPVDVEKSEHIVLWETSEDLSEYRTHLTTHADALETRKYLEVEYFATRRENECIAILGHVLVLGSELRVKEVIDAWKNGYKKGPKSAALQAEIKRADKSKDAWFAFALTRKEQQKIGRGDPLIDMTASGVGALNMAELQNGNLSLDFSSGLNVNGFIGMVSTESAAKTSNLLMTLIQNATTDEDVKALGFESFLSGITFSAQKKDVRMSVKYSQKKFDELIALVTQFAKSVQGPAKAPILP